MSAPSDIAGPWIARAYACHAKTTVMAGDQVVAECGGHGRYGLDCEEDARLIAAAPDLLAALRHAEEWIRVALDQIPMPGVCQENARKDLAQIRAAIARAEGA